jgi:two-component system response regulator AtoC
MRETTRDLAPRDAWRPLPNGHGTDGHGNNGHATNGRAADETTVVLARQTVRPSIRPRGADVLLGDSAAMRQLRRTIRDVAASPVRAVLVEGETGVGKGLVARALHEESARSRGPFVTITCSAVPHALLESELFGHEAGAYTDARTRRPGLFEAAAGGTLLVDEVGDLHPALQGAFLGVLEDRRFRRLGGTREIETDVRVVTATNRDLRRLAADGTFRLDLLYRLRVFVISVPPLRSRAEDVPMLVRHFAEEIGLAWGQAPLEVEERTLAALARRAWPGNVREVRNAVERAAVLARGSTLSIEHFPEEVQPEGQNASKFRLPPAGIQLREFVDDLLEQALNRVHGNQSAAARLLGVSRDFVRHRAKRMRPDDVRPRIGSFPVAS